MPDVKNARDWTVAYRKPRAHHFRRADLKLTWQEAHELSQRFRTARPGYEVYYVPTAEVEQGYRNPDDRASITTEDGIRWPVREGGRLPWGVRMRGTR